MATYRADIDGLRAVAVLAVVLHHLSANLVPGGYVGVDVFFVISGYLITGIIGPEIREGRFSFARFYLRRARRIFPALFVVLLATLAAGYFLLLPSDYAATLRAGLGTVFFGSNLVLWRDLAAGYFAATDGKLNPLLHTWSLGVEEQFYLFFPVLLLACHRWGRRYLNPILLIFALLTFVAAAALVSVKPVAVFFLSPFRAWELFAGSMLALGAVRQVRSRLVAEIMVATGLGAIFLACAWYTDRTMFPGLSAALPVAGAVFVIHGGAWGPTLAGRLLTWRPAVLVGLISYSLYLWHWPLIVFVEYTTRTEVDAAYVAAMLAASIALASLSYFFVERPFRKGPVLGAPRIVVSYSSATAAVVTVVALVGLMQAGYAGRFAPGVVALDQARSPSIPYVQCDSKLAGSWCVLGEGDAEPTTLLWGDSHLLAWAPALQNVFAKHGQRAWFAPFSACSPVLLALRSAKSVCAEASRGVEQFILSHPSIKKVVLSARWVTYFAEDQTPEDVAQAGYALVSTVRWLKDHGKEVDVIGQVPSYRQSVPLTLALEAAGRRFPQTSDAEQSDQQRPFLAAVAAAQPERFSNPTKWLCYGRSCKVMADGVPLYRDSNHLSVAGARALESQLAEGIGF